jgi:RNA polymerase sigma-70 factor (ECF subfamily)
MNPVMLPFLINLCHGNLHDALDIRQESLRSVAVGIRHFNEKNLISFKAWFFRICSRKFVDFLRTGKLRGARLDYALESVQMEMHDSDHVQQWTPQTIANVEYANAILQRLSFDERTVLTLRYEHDLSIKNIAKVLMIGKSAVKMRIKRALDKARAVATRL